MATAYAFGVAPTAFTTFILILFGIDAGFYMDAEFIGTQHRWLLSIAAFLTVPTLITAFFVTRALRSASSGTAHLKLVLVALVATLCWNWMFTGSLRSMLEPVVRSGELATLIDAHSDKHDAIGLTYRVEGTALHISIPVDEQIDLERVGGVTAGPAICRTWGRVFAGPVTVLHVGFVAADGTGATVVVERDDCRSWYLSQRIPSNRPMALLASTADPILARVPRR